MAEDVYEALATHLDSLPAGFARTDSGVEMRILRRLFTPEDAELAVRLTVIPEEARVIARRAKLPVSEAASRLKNDGKGAYQWRMQQGDETGPLQWPLQWVLGFLGSHKVDRPDPELVEDALEYERDYIQPANG